MRASRPTKLVGIVWGIASMVLAIAFGSPVSAQSDGVKQLLTEAAEAREDGDYELAVELLLKAYDEFPDPGLLYNAAAAYDDDDECESAFKYYVMAAQAAGKLDEPRTEIVASVQDYLLAYQCTSGEAGIAQLLGAYQHYQDAGLAVNLARRYRKSGDCQAAKNYYFEGLELAEKGSRAHDEAFSAVKELKCQEVTELPPPPPPTEPWEGNLVAVGAMGVGGALLATGFTFDILARLSLGDVDDLASGGNTQAFRDAKDEAVTRQLVARITYVTGAAAAITGGVLWYLDIRPFESGDANAWHLVPTVGPGFAGVAVSSGY